MTDPQPEKWEGFHMTPIEAGPGHQLRQLAKRAGISMTEVAHRMGLAGASSVQRYFDLQPGERLSLDVAARMAPVFVGKGDPPITSDEVFAMCGAESPPIQMPSAPRDADTMLAAANRIADALEKIADLLARPRGPL